MWKVKTILKRVPALILALSKENFPDEMTLQIKKSL
jgi:hypothetical protein